MALTPPDTSGDRYFDILGQVDADGIFPTTAEHAGQPSEETGPAGKSEDNYLTERARSTSGPWRQDQDLAWGRDYGYYDNGKALPRFWSAAPGEFVPRALTDIHSRRKRAMLIFHKD